MTDGSDGQSAAALVALPFAGAILKPVCCLILLVAAFYISLCSSALICSSVGAQKRSAEEGKKGALRALELLAAELKYKNRADAGFAFCFISAAALLYNIVLNLLLSEIIKIFGNEFLSKAIITVLSIIILCIIYGIVRVAPAEIGKIKADRVLMDNSGVFEFICAVFAPLSGLCRLVSLGILRLTGTKPEQNTGQLTEEEILMMVDEGEETGIIGGNTKDMIENVFDFDDTDVSQIMTHRKDIAAVRDDAMLTDVVRIAMKSGNSRIPVYHDDIDNIVGIIHVKELLKFIENGAPQEHIGSELIKEAVFVPESKPCSEMFEYMTSHKTQIAIVVDEFGGTEGIVTMEDLVESIVGNIQDEYDNEDDEIKRLDENSFTVDGATSLDEISELTGLDFSGEENDTIAGVMLDRMGHIPKNGEHPSVVIKGVRFTVQEVENLRISKILIVCKHHQNSDNEKIK